MPPRTRPPRSSEGGIRPADREGSLREEAVDRGEQMRARLIVTTIVMAGLALAVGAIALAGKPAPPNTSQYPDLRAVVPDHLNLVNQQQSEFLRFSNGIANTGRRPVGTATGSADRDGGDHERHPGDPLVECAVPLQYAAEAERPVLHGPLGEDRLDFEYHADAQPLAHRRCRAVRGSAGEARQPDRWWARTRSRSASASSTSTSSTEMPRRARRCSGTATRATRAFRPVGWTSTTRRRTASRSS